jgi:membrane protease YdiL (CAAX protease family)
MKTMPAFHSMCRSTKFRAIAVFLTLWAACVAFLAATGGNFLFPISSMVIFGGVMSGVAILLTRKANAPAVPVRLPARESVVLLMYLAVYAFVAFGPVMSAVKSAFPPGPAKELAVVGYKLVVHLILPAILIVAAGGWLRGIVDAGLRRKGVLLILVIFSALMIGLVAALNSIFETLAATGLSQLQIVGWIAAAWLWMSIEAGLCEEFLFRGLLQSRLTAWFGSAAWSIVTMAVVFALVHVPGFYLRGGEEVARQAQTLPQIIALAIGAIGPIALMFGILWQRTW